MGYTFTFQLCWDKLSTAVLIHGHLFQFLDQVMRVIVKEIDREDEHCNWRLLLQNWVIRVIVMEIDKENGHCFWRLLLQDSTIGEIVMEIDEGSTLRLNFNPLYFSLTQTYFSTFIYLWSMLTCCAKPCRTKQDQGSFAVQFFCKWCCTVYLISKIIQKLLSTK